MFYVLTPLESLNKMAAWCGSNVPSGLNTLLAAPSDALLLSASSAEALRI